jgi:hypothetical protein
VAGELAVIEQQTKAQDNDGEYTNQAREVKRDQMRPLFAVAQTQSRAVESADDRQEDATATLTMLCRHLLDVPEDLLERQWHQDNPTGAMDEASKKS